MPDHRWRSAARAALLSFCAAGVGCTRVATTPVAPFGGALAEPLPYRDVIGLLRFRPGEELVGPQVEWLLGGGGDSHLVVLGPSVEILALLADSRFVPDDEPFAIVLLDSSVHGALAAFAWRGGAEPFRAAARARGLALPTPDQVELPGRGRIGGVEELTLEVALQIMSTLDDETVAYHIVERDGLTLLLPARDGARNVVETLERTRALAPESGRASLFRLELGAVVDEARDALRQAAMGAVSLQLSSWSDGPFPFNDWRLYGTAGNLIEALLDLTTSIDHLFAVVDDAGIELYLRAEEGGFFAHLLPMARNVPLEELLAGAPRDAPFVAAASFDPKVLADLPSIWESSTRGPFRRSHRRFRHYVDAEVVEDEQPPFLASFGGRAWVALAPPDWSARIYAQLDDDATNEGPLAALLAAMLPHELLDELRKASLLFYGATRAPGGCLEVVGTDAAALLAQERERLSGPAPVVPPAGAPAEAFLVARVPSGPGDESRCYTLTMTRDAGGVRVRLLRPSP